MLPRSPFRKNELSAQVLGVLLTDSLQLKTACYGAYEIGMCHVSGLNALMYDFNSVKNLKRKRQKKIPYGKN